MCVQILFNVLDNCLRTNANFFSEYENEQRSLKKRLRRTRGRERKREAKLKNSENKENTANNEQKVLKTTNKQQKAPETTNNQPKNTSKNAECTPQIILVCMTLNQIDQCNFQFINFCFTFLV